MGQLTQRQIKVQFPLTIREDGFPPVGSESLNGTLIDDGLVKLDNTPFFVEGIALGDVVAVRRTDQHQLMIFDRVVKEGTSRALSIIFLTADCEDEVYQYLRQWGCYCEYGEFGGFNMLAVEVPARTSYARLSPRLLALERQNKLSLAELCI